MLTTTQLVGFGGGGGALPAVVTWLDDDKSNTNAAQYDWAAINFGTPSPDRWIVVACFGQVGSSGHDGISSVTIGGVTATILREFNNGFCDVVFAAALVPEGTNGTVSVIWNEQQARDAMVCWGITSLYEPLLTATDSARVASELDFGSGAGNGALYVPAGGVVLGATIDSGVGNRTWTWTGITRDVQDTYESGRSFSGASLAFALEQAALDVSATPSGGTTDGTFGVISLR